MMHAAVALVSFFDCTDAHKFHPAFDMISPHHREQNQPKQVPLPKTMPTTVTPPASSQGYSEESESEDSKQLTSDVSASSTRASSSCAEKKLQFPWKLHQVLDEAESAGFSSVIAWMSDGKSFKIFNKRRLESEVMPTRFSSSKFKSFQRSLNLWGFRVIQSGNDKGQCYHPLFVRGKPNLCFKMDRTKVKVPGKRAKAAEQRQQKRLEAAAASRQAALPLGESAKISSAASILQGLPSCSQGAAMSMSAASSQAMNPSFLWGRVGSSTDSSSKNPPAMNMNNSTSALLAGILSAPMQGGASQQASLIDALSRLAAIERVKQEQQQQAQNDAINNVLLVMKLIGSRNTNNIGDGGMTVQQNATRS